MGIEEREYRKIKEEKKDEVKEAPIKNVGGYSDDELEYMK